MRLSESDLSELADLSIQAASEAGHMIARSRPQQVEYKDVGGASLASQVVTEIDRRSQQIILDVLAPTLERFDLGLLTEEKDDDGGRLTAEYFWCIDPLDGTLPFIEGSAGYAVSIALVERDGTPQIGVVHDPVSGTIWHAIGGGGAFHDGQPWSAGPTRGEVLSVFADRSFVERDDHDEIIESLEQIAREMELTGMRLNATAGAVMNACGVLANAPACYVKFPKESGGGSLWDFAATACLFREAGAIATDVYGGVLDLNRPDSTSMAHRGVLFATNETLGDRVRALGQDCS